MNLIFDRWIPIRRNDGSRQRIAPWQLTDGIGDNPILAVASPRPDFDGALTQFLIGLLQTTCTPDAFTWRTWQTTPPTPDELRERFATVAHAFELEGERAFMQDFTPSDLKERWPIERILIGSPGKNAIDKGTDHFVKRNSVNSICPHCAAAALYSLQINGPAFGAGYREGLRRGGPITTIVLGEPRFNKKIVTLWEVCALNVLVASRYFSDGVPGNSSDSDRFPWMGKTRTSDGTPARITTPLHVHQDQMYWPMPQRIRLIMNDRFGDQRCDLCGEQSDRVFSFFNVRHHGTLYQNFEHPLSPHIKDEIGIKAVRTGPDGIGYRHWLGLVMSTSDGKNENRPARVIEQFRGEGRLWAFGFNIVAGQANARCWYDSLMPIFTVDADDRPILNDSLERMVRAANYVSSLVMMAVMRATLLEVKETERKDDQMYVKWKWPRDILSRLKKSSSERNDTIESKVNASVEELDRRALDNLLSFSSAARSAFWSSTESQFFKRIDEMRIAIQSKEDTQKVFKAWLNDMSQTAMSLFLAYGGLGDIDINDRRVSLAEYELKRSLNGNRLRQLLLLPESN